MVPPVSEITPSVTPAARRIHGPMPLPRDHHHQPVTRTILTTKMISRPAGSVKRLFMIQLPSTRVRNRHLGRASWVRRSLTKQDSNRVVTAIVGLSATTL